MEKVHKAKKGYSFGVNRPDVINVYVLFAIMVLFLISGWGWCPLCESNETAPRH